MNSTDTLISVPNTPTRPTTDSGNDKNMMELKQLTPIIDHETFLYIMFVNLGIICQSITVFGTVANIINLIIFVKQGFSDSINICLTALAVSDLCSLLTMMFTNLCFTPAFSDLAIPLVTTEIHLITGSWMHVAFTRISGWITAFISFERCVCVILPLKVKTMFTGTRHIIAMVIIYVFTLSWASMAYISVGIGWRFYPDKNAYFLGLVYHMTEHQRFTTDAISYAVNGILMPLFCFTFVVIFTSVLVFKLNKNASWRLSHSSASSSNNQFKTKNDGALTTRDQRVAKMVVFISALFITSFIPCMCIMITTYVWPDLNYDGQYKNLFLVTMSVSFTTEVINSSFNIFIYLKMSTKYRETFQKMFTFNCTLKTAQPV